MSVRVTCLGGAVIDMIYAINALPGQDGKYPVTSFVESGGGMAANAAVAVSRLGGQGVWCGVVGDDDKGRRILDGLREERVDVRLARSIPGISSSHSIVMKDTSGNRAILLYRSDETPTNADWLPLDRLLTSDVVLADNRWIEGAERLLDAARDRGLPRVVDIDSAGDRRALGLAERASHAIYSAPGLDALFDGATAEDRLRAAARLTPFAAFTAGGEGVFWISRDSTFLHLPAFAIDAVETVGAGDVFHGAFALAIGENQEESQALRFAAACSALKCAGHGGRMSFPTRSAVNALLAKTDTETPS